MAFKRVDESIDGSDLSFSAMVGRWISTVLYGDSEIDDECMEFRC